jgi:preprotein translocase subunit Sss1
MKCDSRRSTFSASAAMMESDERLRRFLAAGAKCAIAARLPDRDELQRSCP